MTSMTARTVRVYTKQVLVKPTRHTPVRSTYFGEGVFDRRAGHSVADEAWWDQQHRLSGLGDVPAPGVPAAQVGHAVPWGTRPAAQVGAAEQVPVTQPSATQSATDPAAVDLATERGVEQSTTAKTAKPLVLAPAPFGYDSQPRRLGDRRRRYEETLLCVERTMIAHAATSEEWRQVTGEYYRTVAQYERRHPGCELADSEAAGTKAALALLADVLARREAQTDRPMTMDEWLDQAAPVTMADLSDDFGGAFDGHDA